MTMHALSSTSLSLMGRVRASIAFSTILYFTLRYYVLMLMLSEKRCDCEYDYSVYHNEDNATRYTVGFEQ